MAGNNNSSGGRYDLYDIQRYQATHSTKPIDPNNPVVNIGIKPAEFYAAIANGYKPKVTLVASADNARKLMMVAWLLERIGWVADGCVRHDKYFTELSLKLRREDE